MTFWSHKWPNRESQIFGLFHNYLQKRSSEKPLAEQNTQSALGGIGRTQYASRARENESIKAENGRFAIYYRVCGVIPVTKSP